MPVLAILILLAGQAALPAGDTAHRTVTVEALTNLAPAQWDDPEVRVAAGRLLLGNATSHEEKLLIAWSAIYSNHFNVVRPAIKELLTRTRKDSDARELARVFAAGIDDRYAGEPTADLVEFFDESTGIRREEAAIEIAAHSRAALPGGLKNRVIDTLTQLMLDAKVPPADRGRAIEAVQFFATDNERLTAALLALSDPARWFDGVQGAHYLESSIVNVIYALGERRSFPAVAQRLTALPNDIATSRLSEFDQWLATGALKWVLSNRLATGMLRSPR